MRSGMQSISAPPPPPACLSAAVYIELGEIAIRQGDYAKAIELLEQAVDSNPADAVALADLAVAQRLHGDAQAAASTSAKAKQQMPLLPYALAEHWLDTSTRCTSGHAPSAPIRKTISRSQPGITTSVRGSRRIRCCTLPSLTCPVSHSRPWSITTSPPTAGNKAIRNKQCSSLTKHCCCPSRRSSPTASRMRPF